MDQLPQANTGHNTRQASRNNIANATPMRVVHTEQPSSAVSSLTSHTTASASSRDPPAPAPTINNNKRSTAPPTLEDTPSPKKNRPDFSKPLSDDKEYLSGDDEEGWGKEEDQMLELIRHQHQQEELNADEMEDVPAVEVAEWEHIAEGNFTNGNPDEQPEAPVEYETIEVSEELKGDDLKAIAKAIGVGVSGKKYDVYRRIRLSGKPQISRLNPDDPNKVLYTRVKEVPKEDVGKWLLLNPISINQDQFPGIDLKTGAEGGYFGPTNKDNIEGAEKHNFLMGGDRIKRPTFTRKARRKAPPPPPSTASSTSNTTGQPSNPSTNNTPSPSESGGVSDAARDLLPDDLRKARPIHFFNTQITPKFVKEVMVDCTNARAGSEGASTGGTIYTDYVPFDVPEMYRCMGLLFANGLSPKPSIELWFESSIESRLFGNDYISSALDKLLSNGKTISGKCGKWFECCAYDMLHI